MKKPEEQNLIPHSEKIDVVLEELETSASAGLSPREAKERLLRHGENRLAGKKRKTLARRFAGQFADVMILILLAAAAVSLAVSVFEHESFFEPVLIVAIVVLNAVIGVVQESRAEKALDALKSLSSPHARVIRGGAESVIDAAGLVPGDIIKVEAGDFIPADARLLSAASLKVDESALTGESVPAEKDPGAQIGEKAPIGDRVCMVYSGCAVSYGRGVAVVTSTGMDTEMGKIAALLNEGGDERTPLQEKLASLGKYLGIAALAACAVIFIIGLIDGIPLMEIFMTSVSLAVAAIPEGLPAIVTIVLAIGVQRMVKRNAIIRRLPAVETLGSASVICSDKTGTLTQNKMTLTTAFAAQGAAQEDITGENSAEVKKLLLYAALCCDGSVEQKDGREVHIGDPTETAIVLAAMKNGFYKDELEKKYPRLSELPFESERKLMTTVNRIDGKLVVITKGSFDSLAGRCVSGDIAAGKTVMDELSEKALRVLAVGYREIEKLPEDISPQTLENGLTFMGLVGMIDPPRPEAREAVRICREAGIKPVMITGDHVVTARAIARDLGIQTPGDLAVTGGELSNMTDDELIARVGEIAVYARVSPSDKIRIVRAWQKRGEVVAMTGDGVNDAPALKAADIGCAMGITGTDVAKGAADMTLTDDNFATIVEAVREGRSIYDNIKKVVGFLLGTNIGEIFTVFFAMLIWRVTPLLSMQLLWINLVTDSLPAVALGMEPPEDGIMGRKPIARGEGVFSNGFGLRILLQGMLFAALTIAGFITGWKTTGDLAAGRTMAFFILATTQIVHSFNMRSQRSLFKIGFFTNKRLTAAAALSLALTALIMFVPPLTAIFGLRALGTGLYLEAIGLSLVPLPVIELSKLISRKKRR